MKDKVKQFKNYSLFITISLAITGIIGIISGIVTIFFSFIILLSSTRNIFIFSIINFAFYLFVGLLYIGVSVFSFFIANQYLKRSIEAQQLIDLNEEDKESELSILKSIERREFWIERLYFYPLQYGVAISMILSIVFAPLGILMILSAEKQRKMDLLKDAYNFNSDQLTLETRVRNSSEIFEQIRSKAKFDTWTIVLFLLSSVLFVIITVGLYMYMIPQPTNTQRQNPPIYFDIPSEFERE